MADPAAPIIVTAELASPDQSWAESLRQRHFPPERNRVPAHISLFHHLPPSLEPELRDRLKAIATGPKPLARIEGVMSLGNGVAIVLTSRELLDLRDHLAAAFAHHLIPQDRHKPRLHITIQNKVTSQIAAQTLEDLRAIIEPRATHIAALACWHYRGGPWSPIGRWAFRG